MVIRIHNFFLNFQPALKTLVTVTEMLTKHKQKYMQMINTNTSGSNTQSTNSNASAISHSSTAALSQLHIS